MVETLQVWLGLRTDRRAVTAIEYALVAAVLTGAITGVINVVFADLGSQLAAKLQVVIGA